MNWIYKEIVRQHNVKQYMEGNMKCGKQYEDNDMIEIDNMKSGHLR